MATRTASIGSGDRQARSLYLVTITVGSFLLFLMQPMVARMALPRLGGAPAVWNSAMLVYQALLLAGYGYAHALRRLPLRRQAIVHGALFLAAAGWLPIGLIGWMPRASGDPVLAVPVLLFGSIGPLFFVVSAQAPLMQRWFAARHPGVDPFRLYAASNLGSFAGLIAYPLLIEPLLSMHAQSRLWSAGYALLMLCVLAAAAGLPAARGEAPAAAAPAGVGARRWLGWAGLAAIPSGLMLSTSTHLTTDLIAMPLLWVLPLGLYLLSFSIAFSDQRGVTRAIGRAAPPLIVASAALTFLLGGGWALVAALLGLLMLFAVSVALHGTLYRRRPAAEQLTSFYLALSVGGVGGGLFCALLAPLIFDWVYEHPILLLASAAVLPATAPRWGATLWAGNRAALLDRYLPVAAFLLSLVAAGLLLPGPPALVRTAAGLAIAAAALAAIGRRRLFTLLVAFTMLAFGGWTALLLSVTTDARARSYFGVYTVAEDASTRSRLMIDGTTLHGLQRLDPGHEFDETGYYVAQAGSGIAMRALPALYGPHARVGVVGLGAGVLACYRQPGQDWRFYEIDPTDVRIARTRFSFLSRCAPDAPVIVGDGRLSLSAERGRSFDLLAMDAFSSDSVPMHLLTREAFATYDARLAPGGVLLFNITNRAVDLEPVLAAAAAERGWSAALRVYTPDRAAMRAGALRSVWVILARDPATIARIEATSALPWRPLHARPGMIAWSDDFASILPLLRLGGAR